MNRVFLVRSIVIILVFGLVGCGAGNNDEYNTIEEPKVFEESNQVDDFKVTIKIEKDKELAVTATIAYLGEKDKIEIYHGGSIFFFNIYQKDGNFEYIGMMNQPLLTTTLTRNEPQKVEFTDTVLGELEPGTYEIEAKADFSLDKEFVGDSRFNIPVSSIIKIE